MARTEPELTDAQWAALEPLLPPQRPATGRPTTTIASTTWRWSLWGRPRIRPDAVASDKGYSYPPKPAALPAPPWHPRGDPVQVLPGPPARLDKAAYRERNQVERTVNRLKQFRRVATRYERREANYLAMVTIAAIVLLWLE
jgi:transposase